MLSQGAPLTLALAIACGVMALILARLIRVPGIILLLAFGVCLGPDVLGFIDPATLGDTLTMIVGMAVAVILFEGGLNLEASRLRAESSVINRLITVGAFVTATVGAFCCHFIMGWTWQLSLLFGTLIIVTGPTVVTPLLKRLKIKKNIQTILEAEGVLIDPVGAIIAVVALDSVITSSAEGVALGMLLFVAKLAFGFLVGVAGGFFIGYLLKHRRIVPDDLENIMILGMVLFLFEFSNSVLHESGIMTVTVAGVVIGNMKIESHESLIEFKEQLTYLLIGTLFVLLAADVRMADMLKLGWPGFLTVLSVMFIVRPINILVCTRNTNLTFKEKIFMSWLAPRGIIAAAVAALFAVDLKAANIEGGTELRSLVFLVIATTVVFQGFTAGPLASFLGLRLQKANGWLIVGANQMGRLLAQILSRNGEEVVLLDRNVEDYEKSKKAGLKAILGNALDDGILDDADVTTRRGVVTVTPSLAVNLMIARKVEHMTKDLKFYVGVGIDDKLEDLSRGIDRGRALFGGQFDLGLWNRRLRNKGCVLSKYVYGGKPTANLWEDIESQKLADSIIPLAIYSKSYAAPFTSTQTVEKGFVVYFLVLTEHLETVLAWLEQHDFQLSEDGDS